MATPGEERRRSKPQWLRGTYVRWAAGGVGFGLAMLLSAPFGAYPASAAGYGVSPATITVGDALRGHVYERSVQLFGLSVGGPAAVFGLSVSGPAGSWMRLFDPRDPMRVPIAQAIVGNDSRDTYIGLQIAVPAEVANGSYTGVLTLTGPGTGPGSEGVDMSAQVPVQVDVAGSQNLAGELVRVSTLADAEVDYPAQISVLVRNSGNVDLSPSVSLRFAGPDGKTVGQVSAPPGTIRPGDSANFDMSWDTRGRPAGTYLVESTVSAGGTFIGRGYTRFHLLTPAEDPRAGQIISLRLSNSPLPRELDEVVARFVNIGALGVAAQFQGRLHCDGRDLGVISSPDALVARGRSTPMVAPVRLPPRGTCRVTGAVLFAGTRTASRHLDFRVGSAGGLADPGTAAAAVSATVAVGAGTVTLVRRHRRRTSGEPA